MRNHGSRVFCLFASIASIALAPAFLPRECRAQSTSDKPPVKELGNQEASAALDQLLSRYSAYGFSGTVLVARRDEVLIEKGYGLADRSLGILNKADTLYYIASVTKTVTAAAILKLEMQGKLDTADVLSKYIGELPADKSAITLHHLLIHSSGLPDDDDLSVAKLDRTNRENFLSGIKSVPLRFKPGERFGYSNLGYGVLAAIVEKVSGKSFASFVKSALFKPAGMKDTWFLDETQRVKARIAVGYEGILGGGQAVRTFSLPQMDWVRRGSGGLLATVGDLYKWTQALDSNRILSEAAKNKAYTSYFDDYVYGWWNVKLGEGITHFAAGDGYGFQSWVANSAAPDLKILFIMNTRLGWSVPVFQSLRRVAVGMKYTLPPAVVRIDKTTLDKYAGTYKMESGGEVKVWTEENSLMAGALAQDAINALTGQPSSDAVDVLNQTSGTLVEELARGNFEQLGAYLDLETDTIAQFKDWWQGLFEGKGNFISSEILGTTTGRGGRLITFARVQYEKDQIVIRLVWREKKLIGRGTGIAMPGITRFLPTSDTGFASFDILASKTLNIRFEVSDLGDITLLMNSTKARKVGG